MTTHRRRDDETHGDGRSLASVFQAGPLSELSERFGAPGMNAVGELFLADLVDLQGMEVVLLHLPAEGEVLVDHTFRNRNECVLCIRGEGRLLLGDDGVDVHVGTAFRPPVGEIKRWRNASGGALSFVRVFIDGQQAQP